MGALAGAGRSGGRGGFLGLNRVLIASAGASPRIVDLVARLEDPRSSSRHPDGNRTGLGRRDGLFGGDLGNVLDGADRVGTGPGGRALRR